jgi:hypothetical protein
MTQWDILRYDVRVRKRMLQAQHLSETQLDRHLEQLPDLEAQSETVLANQPGLGPKAGRDAAAVARTPTLQRPGGSDVPKEAWPQQPAPSTPAESAWSLPSRTGISGLDTPVGAAPAHAPVAPAQERAPLAPIAGGEGSPSNADSTATGPGDVKPTGAQQPPGTDEGRS